MILVNLVSGPRNISTALMYSFAQRRDTRVVDEPFYACYLTETGLDHPGRDEVLQSQSNDAEKVSSTIWSDQRKSIVFVKNMAQHMPFVPPAFIEAAINIFLIRNPAQILASYAQVISAPTLADIGIEYQFMLLHQLRSRGKQPLVLDSSSILANPGIVLQQVCEGIGIPYVKEMLQWPVGPKSYDGIWAKYWYGNVQASSGFESQATSNRPLPANLVKVNDQAQYYYKALLSFAVQP